MLYKVFPLTRVKENNRKNKKFPLVVGHPGAVIVVQVGSWYIEIFSNFCYFVLIISKVAYRVKFAARLEVLDEQSQLPKFCLRKTVFLMMKLRIFRFLVL